MSHRDEFELRLMRVEHTQALMLEKLDRLSVAPAPAAIPADDPARTRRQERGLGALGTIALVLVAVAALIWIGDELHLDRYAARLLW